MRNKSCPIVTFKTQRKGKLELLGWAFAAGAPEEAHVRLMACARAARPLGANMVNPKLRYCR